MRKRKGRRKSGMRKMKGMRKSGTRKRKGRRKSGRWKMKGRRKSEMSKDYCANLVAASISSRGPSPRLHS